MRHPSAPGLFTLCILMAACGSQQSASIYSGPQTGTNLKLAISTDTQLSGEQLFIACQACHNLADGAAHKVGPNLYAIIDQPAASREGFRYSDALKNSDLVWNKATLTGWVLATETIVPGTWMTYHNHLSPEETTHLVEYIATKK